MYSTTNITTVRQLFHSTMRESDPRLTYDSIDYSSASEAAIKNRKK